MEQKTETSSHIEIAKRFMLMGASFEKIWDSYRRVVSKNAKESDFPEEVPNEPYILTHLKHWVKIKVVDVKLTRTGKDHKVMANEKGDDGKRHLPNAIVKALKDANTPWKASSVRVTWIVCYLNRIFPKQEKGSGWEKFECSHRCIEDGLADAGYSCIDEKCLLWESKSNNQSRGNRYCGRKCSHENCKKSVCECQGLHDPCCI